MILQELHRLAEAENLVGDPAFEIRPVSWIVELGDDGRFIQIGDHRRNLNDGQTSKTGKPLKAKWVGRDMNVPAQPGRTSGDLSFFLVDKSEYALGLDPTGKRPTEKLRKRLGLFHADVAECAAATGDEVVGEVSAYLQHLLDGGEPPELPADAAANDLFAFRVGDEYPHKRPAVRDWWRTKLGLDDEDASAGGPLRCLVTGAALDDAPLVPLIKSVPGGSSSGVALVSFNDVAFTSYGQKGNANAALSEPAARGVSAALNRLLARRPVDADGEPLPEQRVDLSADTALVFWAQDGVMAQAVRPALGGVSPEDADGPPLPPEVRRAVESIQSGRPPEVEVEGSFFGMTLSGTQGRLIVRDWFEAALADTLAAEAEFFRDVALVRQARVGVGKTEPAAYPIRVMLATLAAEGRSSAVPASLASQATLAAIRGGPLPRGVLDRALLRERAEAGGDTWGDQHRRDLRLGLARAYLRRAGHGWLGPALDPAADDPAYVCGRVVALIERTQREALGLDHAPVTDRFLRTATAEPGRALPPMLAGFRQHLGKIAGDPDEKGAAYWGGLLDELPRGWVRGGLAALAEAAMAYLVHKLDAIPARLSPEQQGVFLIGRHHQHAAFFKPKTDKTKETPTDA